ncbi:hypothetical protein ACSQ76_12370 [Roseovarius sp. B08]|uniref:hypothetical protein n=1 Tax=Roseovarius sp. B08 TaxID=3449223 RepID=UPI003EDC6DB7
MTDHSVERFKEYSTSGAFNLSLSRAQVSALSMIAEHGDAVIGGHTQRALHHKGLISDIRANDGRLEYRLTPAGAYALQLVRMADLVQGPADTVAAEITALSGQLGEARAAAQDALTFARSMQARAEAAFRAIKRLRRFIKSGAPHPKPMISLKDPRRELGFSAMVRALDDLERELNGGDG